MALRPGRSSAAGRSPIIWSETLARVESDLAVHRAEDEGLVDDLVTFVDVLAEPTGLEGQLWKRNQPVRNVETLCTAVDKFAALRVLDIAPRRAPTLRQSVIEVKNRSVAGSTWVWERIARRSRTASDELDELNAGNSETADGRLNEADPDVFDNWIPIATETISRAAGGWAGWDLARQLAMTTLR